MFASRAVSAIVLAAGCLLFAPSVAAAQYGDGVRYMIRLGAEHGGEKVLEFEYSDGSTPDVPAGAGIVLAAGAALPVTNAGRGAIEAQVNLGLKFRTIPPATNQEATWLRFPLEGLAMYRAPNGLRVGGGPTVHLANVLKASGEALNDKVTFKATPGLVLQADYLVGQWALDLRYSVLTYKTENAGEVDASSIGAGASFWFGRAAPKPRSKR